MSALSWNTVNSNQKGMEALSRKGHYTASIPPAQVPEPQTHVWVRRMPRAGEDSKPDASMDRF